MTAYELLISDWSSDVCSSDLAILVLMVFSYQLGWFPPGGMISIGGYQESFWATIFTWDFLHHLILPTLVLMSREITSPALLLRSTMLEVKGSDFLEILRAKEIGIAHA